MKIKRKIKHPVASSGVSVNKILRKVTLQGIKNIPERLKELSRWRNYSKELSLFFSAILFAYFFGWNTTDLIWGLWITSFVVGNISLFRSGFVAPISSIKAILTYENLKEFKIEPASEKLKFFVFVLIAAPFYLGFRIFLILHFSIFHIFHAWVLIILFPHPDLIKIIDDDNNGGQFSIPILIVKTLLMSYWIIVLQKLLFDHIKHGENTDNDDSDFIDDIKRPYLQVFRIHILIFIMVGLNEINANQYLIYVVIYSLFFFPLSIFSKTKSEND